MRNSSFANNAASSPPVPALISRMTSFWSNGSLGINSCFKDSSEDCRFNFKLPISDFAISIRSLSFPSKTAFKSSCSLRRDK